VLLGAGYASRLRTCLPTPLVWRVTEPFFGYPHTARVPEERGYSIY
jgi:hypothetical protein